MEQWQQTFPTLLTQWHPRIRLFVRITTRDVRQLERALRVQTPTNHTVMFMRPVAQTHLDICENFFSVSLELIVQVGVFDM